MAVITIILQAYGKYHDGDFKWALPFLAFHSPHTLPAALFSFFMHTQTVYRGASWLFHLTDGEKSFLKQKWRSWTFLRVQLLDILHVCQLSWHLIESYKICSTASDWLPCAAVATLRMTPPLERPSLHSYRLTWLDPPVLLCSRRTTAKQAAWNSSLSRLCLP